MEWTRSRIFVDGYDSADGNFRIIPARNGNGYLLIMFEHEDANGNPMTRRFPTVGEAKAWAESS